MLDRVETIKAFSELDNFFERFSAYLFIWNDNEVGFFCSDGCEFGCVAFR